MQGQGRADNYMLVKHHAEITNNNACVTTNQADVTCSYTGSQGLCKQENGVVNPSRATEENQVQHLKNC